MVLKLLRTNLATISDLGSNKDEYRYLKATNSEEKEYIDEAIGDLIDAGWVLTSRNLNKSAE